MSQAPASPLPANRAAIQALAELATPSAQITAMVRWAIAHPHATAADAAVHFGIQKSTAARILNSDGFHLALNQTLKELDVANGLPSLGEKITAATALAVEELMEKVPNLPPEDLIDAVDVLSKAHGRITGKPQPGGPVVNLTLNNQIAQINGARQDMLDKAKEAGPYPEGQAAPKFIERGED